MSLLINTRLFSIAGCFFCMLIGENFILKAKLNYLPDSPDGSICDHRKGYNDIVFFQGRYIAVGSGGCIDCITPSGEKIHLNTSCRYDLNCAYAGGKIFLAAGDSGTILLSKDGIGFYTSATGTKMNIHTITCKNGIFVAGADSGIMLSSTDGISWVKIRTNIKGNILSISANNFFFIGVSDSGEIIKSTDGENWEIKEYNKEYAGYNPQADFRKILAGANSVIIAGTHSDGSPSFLFSILGNVWNERPPIYQDEQGVVQNLNSTPNGIAYDGDRDQFVIACDKGELFVLSPCAKCNKWIKLSDSDFHAILYRDNSYLIVGEEFSVKIQREF